MTSKSKKEAALPAKEQRHFHNHTHCKTMVQKYYTICIKIFQGAVMDFLERRKIIQKSIDKIVATWYNVFVATKIVR